MRPKLKFHSIHITTSVLILWLLYACIYSLIKNQQNTFTLAGYISLAGEMGLDMLAAFLSFHLWKNTTHAITKKIYATYFFSFIAAILADGIYNILLNLFGFAYNNILVASFFEIPFVVFLFFQLTVLSIILSANGKQKIKFTTISYLPYVLGSVLMFMMFMFGMPWKIKYSSLLGIFQATDTVLEVIGFSLATIILSRAKNNIVYFLVIGYLLIVSSDLVIRYSVISGQIPYLSSLEATWVLGLLLICLGLFFTVSYQRTDLFHLSPINSLRSQITMWLLTLWMLSAFLLAAALYFFTPHMEDNLNHIIKNLLFLLIPFSLLATIFSRYVSLKIAYPLTHIENSVNTFFESDNMAVEKLKKSKDKSIFEFTMLENFVFEAFTLYKQKNEIKFEFAKKAEQLAHDIRSPLAAINTVLIDLASISEKKRIILRNAARRINDIANHFLSQNIALEKHKIDNEKKLSSELLFVALENIISEKRYEYHETKINIQLDITTQAYAAFANINLPTFKRIISNLINNSIEACNSAVCVSIYLDADTHHAEITIQDNGCGIPPGVIAKVTEQGFSFNKQQGAGLGLYYAKKYIENLHGTLHINSQVNNGTKVIIMLPISQPPQWFCHSLQIQANSPILILDDDNAIHEAWENRLIHYMNNVHHFYKASDLTRSCKKMQNALYLVDYELLPGNKSGVDIIEDLNLQHQAILVSSNFEDDAIRDRCILLGLKIIPKLYVPYIPISLTSDQQMLPSLVLVDDDEIIRATWELAAQECSKNIVTYSAVNDFISDLHRYQKNAPIYIDSNLGNNQKGEAYAKEIYKQGYKEIYLTTGHSADKYGHMPWIKAVVGKSPPFLDKQA